MASGGEHDVAPPTVVSVPGIETLHYGVYLSSQILRVLKYSATDVTTQLKLSSSFKQHSTTQLKLSRNPLYSTKLLEY